MPIGMNATTGRRRMMDDQNDQLPGMSVEGIGRAMAMPTPGAGTMRTFLNMEQAADRADTTMGNMRIPMSPGRRAIMDLQEQRADRANQRVIERIQAAPVSFGDGAGVLGGRYVEPAPRTMMEVGADGTVAALPPGATEPVVNRAPQPQQMPWDSTPNGAVNRQTGEVVPFPEQKSPWQPSGNGAVNVETGEVRAFPKQDEINKGLQDGQMVEGMGRWSTKFGTFIDDKGQPLFAPANAQGVLDMSTLMMMTPDQRKTYFDNLAGNMEGKATDKKKPTGPGSQWEM